MHCVGKVFYDDCYYKWRTTIDDWGHLPVIYADCDSASRLNSFCDCTHHFEILWHHRHTSRRSCCKILRWFQVATGDCKMVNCSRHFAGYLMHCCFNFYDANAFLSLRVIFVSCQRRRPRRNPLGCAAEIASYPLKWPLTNIYGRLNHRAVMWYK